MRAKARSRRGAILTEYAAAFSVFVCFFLVPMVDLAFIPARHFLASGAIQELGYRLAHCRKRSEAYAMLNNDSWCKSTLKTFGFTVGDPKLQLIACAKDHTETKNFAQGEALPTAWKPDGTKGPCIYTMDLSMEVQCLPFFVGKLPGFNSPVTFKLGTKAQWENLGCDPSNGEYFINE